VGLVDPQRRRGVHGTAPQGDHPAPSGGNTDRKPDEFPDPGGRRANACSTNVLDEQNTVTEVARKTQGMSVPARRAILIRKSPSAMTGRPCVIS
jgi:hypothetical protein